MKNKIEFLFVGLLMLAAVIATSAGDVIFKDGALNVSDDLLVDTDVLFVDSTNNRVGIGTTNPAYPLEINKPSSRAIYGIGGMGSGDWLYIGQYKSGNDSQLILSSGNDAADSIWIGGDGVGGDWDTGRIDLVSNKLVIWGDVGIGDTNPNSTLTVKAGGTTLADSWDTRSDRNLKQDINNYTTLNILDNPLQIYTYKLKYKDPIYGVNSETGEKEIIGYEDKLTKQHLGIMADEAPAELVGADGKSIDLYAFVSYVYAYSQELKKENEALKARIEALENK